MTGGQILNKLVEQKVISQPGLSWLTLAVDPWHDNSVTGFEGLPDQGIGKSVTFQVVQEYSISKANSPIVLPSGNWSCRIGNFPILQPMVVSPGSYYGDVISQDETIKNLMIPVQVNYAPDGTDFADVAVDGLANSQGCSLPVEYSKGIVKVCGVGIEVINTTSELYKQGLMSCCRMVQPEVEPYMAYIAMTGNVWSTKTMTPMRTLPKNLKEMALYPGFAQDEAKNGYYAPVLLKFGKERHFPVPTSVCLMDDDPSAGPVDTVTPIACYTSTNTLFNVPGNTTNFYTNRSQPLYYGCDSNTIMFTGLSEQTTLTLRVRWIMERFPSDAEGQILVIATPSATYDPAVLEIYSKAVQMLPAGVPFTENPGGEWWRTMLTEIGKVAAPLVKQLPIPFAQGLGRAIETGVDLLGDVETNKKLAADVRKANKAKAAVNKIPAPAKNVGSNQQGRIPPGPGPKKKKKRNRKKKEVIVVKK